MATPINKIGFGDLAPTLNILTKAGGTTDHMDWIRSGKNEANARMLLAFINEKMRVATTPKVELYEDEEAKSSYGYLSGYKPKSVAYQMATLKSLFPQLKSFDKSAAVKELQSGSEGNFLIPRWQELAPTYGDAVELVLAALEKSRNGRFFNYCENRLGPDRFRESAKKADMFQKLGDEQKGDDVLVVQAQFGLRHRGKSVRRARVVMGSNECGLGAFEIGIMLLTHKNRLQHCDDLWIDAAGDEFAPDADGSFYCALCFRLHGRDLEFSSRGLVYPNIHYGSASAFVPPVVVPSE